jgi:hypothetical protein
MYAVFSGGIKCHCDVSLDALLRSFSLDTMHVNEY